MIEYENEFEILDIFCDADKCGSADTYSGTWNECIEQAKAEQWKIFKDENNDWTHRCGIHYQF